jgi:hypothetical protein
VNMYLHLYSWRYLFCISVDPVDEYKNVYIFIVNQSAIQAVDSPKRQSGQYIIKKILDRIDRIHEARPAGTSLSTKLSIVRLRKRRVEKKC